MLLVTVCRNSAVCRKSTVKSDTAVSETNIKKMLCWCMQHFAVTINNVKTTILILQTENKILCICEIKQDIT